MGKGLTPAQKKLTAELDAIYTLLAMDYWNIEEYEPREDRTTVLKLQKEATIRGYIIMQYTFIDEMLSCEICKYFFGSSKSSTQLWKTKKFQNFNYHILEKLYLLEKLTFVQAFSKIPKNIATDIQELNDVRNAIAHAFFPENLRRYKTKPVYKGKDIFTLEGIELFAEDRQRVNAFFSKRLKGTGYL